MDISNSYFIKCSYKLSCVFLCVLFLSNHVSAQTKTPATELTKINAFFLQDMCIYMNLTHSIYSVESSEPFEIKSVFVAMYNSYIYNKIEDMEILQTPEISVVVNHTKKTVMLAPVISQAQPDVNAALFETIQELISQCGTAIIQEQKNENNIILSDCPSKYSKICISYNPSTYEPIQVELYLNDNTGKYAGKLVILYNSIEKHTRDIKGLLEQQRFVVKSSDTYILNATEFRSYSFQNYIE